MVAKERGKVKILPLFYTAKREELCEVTVQRYPDLAIAKTLGPYKVYAVTWIPLTGSLSNET